MSDNNGTGDMVPVQQEGGSPFDAICRTRTDGSEFWSARDLMPLLDYDKWERFEDAIERAVVAMVAHGYSPTDEASRPGAYCSPFPAAVRMFRLTLHE